MVSESEGGKKKGEEDIQIIKWKMYHLYSLSLLKFLSNISTHLLSQLGLGYTFLYKVSANAGMKIKLAIAF